MISELEGKDINEVISEGMSKLASMPAGTLDVHVFLVYFSSCSLSARHTCIVSHPQVFPLVILVASVQGMVASMFERVLLNVVQNSPIHAFSVVIILTPSLYSPIM